MGLRAAAGAGAEKRVLGEKRQFGVAGVHATRGLERKLKKSEKEDTGTTPIVVGKEN